MGQNENGKKRTIGARLVHSFDPRQSSNTFDLQKFSKSRGGTIETCRETGDNTTLTLL